MRIWKVLSLSFLALFGLAFSSWAMQGLPKKSQPPTRRLLVKFKPGYLATVEKSLPSATLRITSADSAGAIAPFLKRHKLKRLEPLHKEWAARKKRSGQSAMSLSQDIQNKFPERAKRFKGTFVPPDLSQSYILTPDVAGEAELAAVAETLKRDPQIETVEVERVYQAQFTPNDPYYGSTGSWGQSYDDLWGVKKISAGTAWDTAKGNGIVVAVVDTGIDYNHPDLAANVWNNPTDGSHGYNFVNNTNNPLDDYGHGTHVAGTIAAIGNNNLGVIGVAWQSRVMALKGLDASGRGTTSALAQAIQWAVDHGADVINMSWGGPGTSDPFVDPVLAYAFNQGVVLVVAAGNTSSDVMEFYPASSPYVITVSASGFNEVPASFTNFGLKIDVAAPGVDILSLQAAGTYLGQPVSSGYTRAEGTSMAAPHVAGVAAVILSQHPTYGNEQIRSVLRASADTVGNEGFDMYSGYGRLNAQRALAVVNAMEVRIESPLRGATVASPTSIVGTAKGPNFSNYKLEYGAGELPFTWTLIRQSFTAATHAELGVFDPRTLPDGIYTLRLTVTDTQGNVYYDRITLNEDYVSISDPVRPQTPNTALTFKPGVVIPIKGSATGASFQNYKVEWARGINATTGWSNTGITLTQGGLAAVSNGTLGSWTPSIASAADYYTLRLTVQNQGFTSESRTLIYLEPDLANANWPRWIPGGMADDNGLVPAFDATNKIRLTAQTPQFIGTGDAVLRSFPYDGTSMTSLILTRGTYHLPTAVDLNGLAGEEILVGEYGYVNVIRPDQSSYQLAGAPFLGFGNFQPQVQDLLGNGSKVVLALGADYSTRISYLYAWKPDGTQLTSHFPITVPGLDWGSNQVMAVDLDGNGTKEILVVSQDSLGPSFALKAYNADGTPRAGWSEFTAPAYFTQMAAGDLDHDGGRDIVLCYFDPSPTNSKVVVFKVDGTVRPGWPVTMNVQSPGRIALADMDKNGKDEVVFVSYRDLIDIRKADGSPFSSAWPRFEPGKQFQRFSIGDLDGDGLPEILTSTFSGLDYFDPLQSVPGTADLSRRSAAAAVRLPLQTLKAANAPLRVQVSGLPAPASTGMYYFINTLNAYKTSGALLKSWRIPGVNGSQSYYQAGPVIGDFNQDGKTDIALNYNLVSGGGVNGTLAESALIVLSLNVPYQAANMPWPMTLHDPQHSATLLSTLLPVITSAGTATGKTGIAFSYQITATNSPTSFNATGLPAGLVINTTTGLISGTPTTVGVSNVILSAINAGGTGTKTLALTITPPAPVISSAGTATGKVGTAFSYQIIATNSPTSFNATGLPAGLIINTTTGLISGTPTTVGVSNVILSAINAGGTGTKTLVLTITPPVPVISSAGTATGKVGTAFSYQIVATNSPTSFNATGLPAGLIINTTTGLISGTPTTVGVSNVILSAINAGGTGTKTLALTITPPAPVITSIGTATGKVGTAFSYQIVATNGPTSFAASGLPAGLVINTTTGLISGTPTTVGVSNVVLSAINAGGTGTKTLVLTITPPTPVISSAGTATGKVGTAFSYQIIATNSPTSFAASGLPAGLIINTTTGLISGTPTTVGVSNVILSAINAGGTGTKTLVLTITPPTPVISSAGTATGKVGTAFSYQIIATNSPTSFAASALPAGLVINTTTGKISGTPTTVGVFNVVLSAINAGGTGTKTLALTITPPAPVITSIGTATGKVGTAFSYQIVATNSPSSFAASALPAGLVINTTTGKISGTPTTVGVFNVVLSAINAGGTGTKTLALTITPPTPVISSAGTATGKVGTAFSYQIVATNSPSSFAASALPAGLVINTTTGKISGTPTTVGVFNVVLSAINAGGTGTKTLALTITPPTPVISSAGTATGKVGTAFSYQIVATNSPTSFNATGLPAGLIINTTTGLISGTPTTVGVSNVILSAINAGGTGTKTLALTITPPAPVITSIGTATGKGGVAFVYQIIATNSPTSFAASGLPAGLIINTTTGLISGTPTTVGVSNVILSAINAGGTGTKTLALTITPPAPVITSAATASGKTSIAFSYQIVATNSPTGFNAVGLPAGLSINTTTGLITGTPAAVGVSAVTLSATSVNGTGTKALTLTVTLPAPVITSPNTAAGNVGTAFSYQIVATNSPTSFNAPGLPPGLSINTGSGLISGTPTTAGVWSVIMSASNAGGTKIKGVTITIKPPLPVITSAGTASGKTSIAFSYQITATNSPTGFNAVGLPAGLSINTTTGLISGTPTTVGVSAVTLSATSVNGTGTKVLTLTITLPAPVITSPNTAAGNVGTAFSYQIVATNSPTSFNAPGLPPGLSINTGSGLISGTPTTAGVWSVIMSASNAGGTKIKGVTITIKPPLPVITSIGTAGGRTGLAFSYQITATNSPTSFAATGLPAGLSINTTTGLITGTPAAVGVSAVTLSATSVNGTGTKVLTLTVTLPAPVITSPNTAAGNVGTAFSYQIVATNSPTSFNAPGLPPGLSINTVSGLISGTPTTAGVWPVITSAINAGGTKIKGVTITIKPPLPVITSAATATGKTGIAFSYQITATNSPTSFAASGLPAGLIINTTTGQITGTPTIVGVSAVTLSATSVNGTGTKVLTLTITLAAPVITSAGAATATVGAAFSYQIMATNTPTSFNASGLPGGLSVNTGTGLISGTVTAAGTSNVTLSAINSGGTGTKTLTITRTLSLITVNENDVTPPLPDTGARALLSSDLTGLKVYPNPWRSDRHGDLQVTFRNFPLNSSIKIFTVAGHYVKTLSSGSDPATWDLTNDSGDKVASGIYIYLITYQDQKKTGQIFVTR